uniref:NADH dehydrogenase subunit 4 n=1 Tax=Bregmaceros mcclellandi TaxID=2831535 RepID=UPI001EDEFBD6|nr:NADH dehydrogenase subunit 4 [Bregmaceros mcclellandi]UIX24723.1 NADH dehydrogenase subunit 4 [Bregmaceros mcclellandi]
MLKILIPTLLLLPCSWLSPSKWLWSSTFIHSTLIAFFSLSFLNASSFAKWSTLNISFAMDSISTPLIVLSCWLLPLMIIASQNHLTSEPIIRQRIYISLMISLQIFLILTFSATEMILFYVMFETTLIPTLLIITRWGNQLERLNAGTYFLFYTLAGSLPLLISLLKIQADTGSLSLLLSDYQNMAHYPIYATKFLYVGCTLAFLVKLPLYGFHLWLPKAHVEAPVAGSMVLAAILLKLGGYGLIRIAPFIGPLATKSLYPFIILALWGVIMTSSICMRQTDLKSLIAYSSVSHMGLVAAAILIQTPWGLTGAIILMIAHGLTSSALFCLANTNYERTHTRTMILARGLQSALPLMGTWWFFFSLANLALPPLPNLMGELIILTTLFCWSPWTLILTGLGTLITAAYSLYMFLTTQRGPLSRHIKGLIPTFTREHLLISLHSIPLLLLVLKPELIWGWTA